LLPQAGGWEARHRATEARRKGHLLKRGVAPFRTVRVVQVHGIAEVAIPLVVEIDHLVSVILKLSPAKAEVFGLLQEGGNPRHRLARCARSRTRSARYSR